MNNINKTILIFSTIFLATAFSSTCFSPSAIEFTSSDGLVKANNIPLSIRGVNWFGTEFQLAPQGLDKHPVSFYLDLIKSNGFNAIRIPFAVQMILQPSLVPTTISYSQNPDLQGKTGLEVMDYIIQLAGDRGLLVLLDQHRLELNSEFPPLWYDNTYSETDVMNSWSVLVARYISQWNFLGVDLMNEPHPPASWGSGNAATDWNSAATRIGNNIIARNPSFRGLIFVEGISDNPVCDDSRYEGYYWGGNFQPLVCSSISLSNQLKLVYSPHVYGPSVYFQPYFSASNFPSNMPAIWQSQFGFVPEFTGQGTVIGEWGGPLTGIDQAVQTNLVTYLKAKGITSTFYWALNPNPGGDTDGILNDDWTTVNTPKIALLESLLPDPTTFTVESSSSICISGTASSSPGSSSSGAVPIPPSSSSAGASSTSNSQARNFTLSSSGSNLDSPDELTSAAANLSIVPISIILLLSILLLNLL